MYLYPLGLSETILLVLSLKYFLGNFSNKKEVICVPDDQVSGDQHPYV